MGCVTSNIFHHFLSALDVRIQRSSQPYEQDVGQYHAETRMMMVEGHIFGNYDFSKKEYALFLLLLLLNGMEK